MKTKAMTFVLALTFLTTACGGEPDAKARHEPGAGKPPDGSSVAVDAGRTARKPPEAEPPETLPATFVEEPPGTAERECVRVNRLLGETVRNGAVRSGEIVAGPFQHFVRGWHPRIENKLWVAPLHTSRMPGATIERIPLDGQPSVAAVGYEDVAWFAEEAPPNSDKARSTSFYPGGLRLPEPGRWRLVVTSGPDWGCFEVEVG